jgi:pseudaminic acid cytidylyltransferase
MRLAVIPARGGSTRIPDKNVRLFCGAPMLSYGLNAASQSGLYAEIHVSTDSDDIAALAADLGHAPAFRRTAGLAGNDVPLLEVLRWVVRQFTERGQSFDEVCLIYAAAPLIEAADLVDGHEKFAAHGGAHPVITVGRFPTPVERAMRIDDGGLLRWLAPAHRFAQSQDLSTTYFDTGAFLIMAPAHLEEEGFPAFEAMLPMVLPLDKVADINDAEDLALAEALYRGRLTRDADDGGA